MKRVGEFVGSALTGGLLFTVPTYLSFLLLFKAMQWVPGLVRPLAVLLPEWLPAEHPLSLLLILIFCLLIGVLIRTPAARVVQENIGKSRSEKFQVMRCFGVCRSELPAKRG